jgi:hypothetical protein
MASVVLTLDWQLATDSSGPTANSKGGGMIVMESDCPHGIPAYSEESLPVYAPFLPSWPGVGPSRQKSRKNMSKASDHFRYALEQRHLEREARWILLVRHLYLDSAGFLKNDVLRPKEPDVTFISRDKYNMLNPYDLDHWAKHA